jgi:hypothetical protein
MVEGWNGRENLKMDARNTFVFFCALCGKKQQRAGIDFSHRDQRGRKAGRMKYGNGAEARVVNSIFK